MLAPKKWETGNLKNKCCQWAIVSIKKCNVEVNKTLADYPGNKQLFTYTKIILIMSLQRMSMVSFETMKCSATQLSTLFQGEMNMCKAQQCASLSREIYPGRQAMTWWLYFSLDIKISRWSISSCKCAQNSKIGKTKERKCQRKEKYTFQLLQSRSLAMAIQEKWGSFSRPVPNKLQYTPSWRGSHASH